VTAHGSYGGGARAVYCNRWTCDYCGPRRQRQLVARGIAGKPTAFITLTSKLLKGKTPGQAARELLNAFRTVVLRFRREQKKPPGSRYVPTGADRFAHRRQMVIQTAQREDEREAEVGEYLWVFEATKNGWPHLHILWRGRYIPQWWLADQMEMLIGSRVCWVKRIRNPKKQAGYVAKYCGKEPHHFETTKRYSCSKHYNDVDDREFVRLFPPHWKWTHTNEKLSWIKQRWEKKGRLVRDLGLGVIAYGILSDDIRDVWAIIDGPLGTWRGS